MRGPSRPPRALAAALAVLALSACGDDTERPAGEREPAVTTTPPALATTIPPGSTTTTIPTGASGATGSGTSGAIPAPGDGTGGDNAPTNGNNSGGGGQQGPGEGNAVGR